jgi:hypothetical protein
MASQDSGDKWFLQAQCPVAFPSSKALRLSNEDFDLYIRKKIKHRRHRRNQHDTARVENEETPSESSDDDDATLITAPSTTAEARELLGNVGLGEDDADAPTPDDEAVNEAPKSKFVQGLLSHDSNAPPAGFDGENRMRTENGDLAYSSTTHVLVDLLHELEDVISWVRMCELLGRAWDNDPLATLKIIFNARSIHLGKSSKMTFYRCAGWLATRHPMTLISNLRWLSRPVIPKKVVKKDGQGEDEMEVEFEEEAVFIENENDPSRFDVKNGVAHGYWKDLLNILTLAANGRLNTFEDPRSFFEEQSRVVKRGTKTSTQDEARAKRQKIRDNRHKRVVRSFNNDPVHRALHLAVARLFVEQLQTDLRIFNGEDKRAKKYISLCAKWAPSTDRFHDKQTFVVSSIAEAMYPVSSFAEGVLPKTDDEAKDREVYLRHAREKYRQDVAKLRAHLEVVERNLSAQTFDKIKYEKVPSVAMNKYFPLFAQKDTVRFEGYLDRVLQGKSNISGAVLLPSTLVHLVRSGGGREGVRRRPRDSKHNVNQMMWAREQALHDKVIDGQWNSLVQRIKDSGTLENCIAVCDVSGSMSHPVFPDKTCPMDSAIGLSMLIAEATKPPFGGVFITFDSSPSVVEISKTASFREKVMEMERAPWGQSTNFLAVFEKLILPIAVKNKLKQEEMVKRVFVFSDMHFDSAVGWNREAAWTGSFERIQQAYRAAGYEMPELVFWNLAGGRAGYTGSGNPIAPKPIKGDEPGTALMSGYSQGSLKVFLDGGDFKENEDKNDFEMVEDKEGGDGETAVVVQPKREKHDPLSTVMKTISHKAYDMLKVVD